MSASNVFESISLGSSVAGGRQAPRPVAIPESTSEEDEPDPSFLLSSQPQEVHKIKSDNNSLEASKLFDSFNTSKGISSHDTSIYFSQELEPSVFFPEPTLTQDNPIEHLQQRHTRLSKELAKNIKRQGKFLANGSDKLDTVRQLISENLMLLSETNFALNEVYSRDVAQTERLLNNFEVWDRKRGKVLGKIKEIKSSNNRHGQKLYLLLQENTAIDTEIEELEEKIVRLKNKKKALLGEIDETSSVLESRTSKYVELFKNLEQQGKYAIASFFQLHGLPERELSSVIKTTLVDVTFMRNNNENGKVKKMDPFEEPKPLPTFEQSMGIKPYEPETNTQVKESGTPGMKPYNPDTGTKAYENPGMKPYNPEIGTEPYNPEAGMTAYEPDLSSFNHDKGPTPYQEGFAKGNRISAQVKNQINTFVKHLMATEEAPKTPKKRTISVDDINNTVVEKIDVEPIVTLLSHQVEALEDLVLTTSKRATRFHECGLVWKDTLAIIESQESKLSAQISDSMRSKADFSSKFSSILVSVIETLMSHLQHLPRNIFEEQLHLALNNELSAIYRGLSMVAPEKLSLMDGFAKLGFTIDTTINVKLKSE